MIRFTRPLGVTIVAILIWLQGLLYVGGGFYVVVNIENEEIIERLGGLEFAIVQGIASFAAALIWFGVAGGLLRGNPRTRILLTVLLVGSFATGIYITVAGFQPVFGPITMAFAVCTVILVWTGRARTFFRPEPAENDTAALDQPPALR